MVRQTFLLLSSFSRFYISRSRGILVNSCISSTFRYKLNINSASLPSSIAYLSTNRRQKKITPVLKVSSPHETEIKQILDDLDKKKVKEAGESLKQLLTIDTFISDVQSVNLICQNYCKASGPEEGERLLNNLIIDHSFQPNVFSYTTLMSSYSQKADYQACLRLMEEMKSKQFQPDLFSYTSLISAYSKASLPSEGEKILRYLISRGKIALTIAPYSVVMNGYLMKKQPLEAYRIFQDLIKTSIPPGEVTYKTLLYGLAANHPKECEEILLHLKQNPGRFNPDVKLLNQIIHGFCKASGPEEGERLLNTLITDHSFQPDVFSYTTLMTSYSQKADYQACLRLMDEMKSKQIQPDLFSYTSLISAYSKASLPSEGEKVLRDLISRDEIALTVVPYSVVINGYLKKQPLEAYRIFQDLIKTSIPPGEITYKTLLYGLAADYPKECEEILLHLKQNPSNFTLDAYFYNQIIHGFCRVSGPEEGERFLQTLITDHSFQPDVFSYTTLMTSYSQKADYQACLRLMDEMKSKQILPNLFSYTALITAYSKASLPSEGEKVLRDLIMSGEVVLTIAPYHAVINGYILTKQPLEAYRILQELIKTSIPLDKITLITLLNELAPHYPKEAEEILLQWKQNPEQFNPDVKLINYVLHGFCQATGPEEGERFLSNLIRGHEFQQDVGSYTTLMSSYSQKADYQACLRLMEEMKSKQFQPDLFSYISLITAYTNASLPSEGEKVLRYLISRDKIALTVVPYSVVMNGYLKKKQPLEAYRIFQELIKTSIPPDEITYQTLLYGLAADYPKECEEILLHLKQNPGQFNRDVRRLTEIIQAFCKASGPEEGERLLNTLITDHSFQPNLVSYNTLMTSYSQKADYQACLRLMEEMKSKQFQPDLFSYTSLISAYSEASLPSEGEKVLRDLISRDEIGLDIAPYNAVMNGYLKKKQPLEAYRIFQELIKTSISPDEITYQTLLFGLAADYPKECEEILLHLKQNPGQFNLDVRLLNQIIQGFCKASGPEEGERLLNTLITNHSFQPNLVSYNTLMTSYSQKADYQACLRLMDEMKSKQILPNLFSYTALITAYSKASLPSEGEKVLRDLISRDEIGLDIAPYNTVMNGYILKKQPLEAYRIFQELIKTSIPPDEITYQTLLYGLAANHPKECEHVLLHLKQNPGQFNPDVRLLTQIIQGFCKASGPEEGERLLNNLIIDHSFQPNVFSYTTLMSAYSQKADYQACLRLLDEMKLKQIQPSLFSYTSLITAYSKASLPSEGEKVLRYLISRGKIALTVVPYSVVMNGYLMKKQPLEAYRIFQDLIKTSIPPGEVTYQTLLVGLAADYPKEAEHVLLHLKQNPGRFNPDVKLLTQIIQAFCKASGPEEGERFLQTLITDHSFQPNVFSYNTLMTSYSQKADYQACLRLMDEMKSKQIQPDLFSYTSLISAYSKASLPSEGEKVLRDLISRDEIALTVVPYNAVMNGYLMKKQPLEAYRIFQDLIKTSIPPGEITYQTLLYGLAADYPKEAEKVLAHKNRRTHQHR